MYDEPFLIEPTQKDSHGSQHSVIPTLVDMKDSKPIMCRVLNNTNTTVKIPGLTTVGIARRISPGQVMPIVEGTDQMDQADSLQVPVGTKGSDKIDPVIENPESRSG